MPALRAGRSLFREDPAAAVRHAVPALRAAVPPWLARAAVPAMALGGADTVLRTAAGYAVRDPSVLGHPHRRAALVRTFVQLLVCDRLTSDALHADHPTPDAARLAAGVAGYLVPGLLRETATGLSVVAGPRFHAGAGPDAVFQQYPRDLAAAGLDHASAASCLTSVISRLSRSAHGSWLPAAAPVPPVRGSLAAESRRLRGLCRELPAGGPSGPAERALADRYALLRAAAVCAGPRTGHGPGPAGPPGWPALALTYLTEQLGLPAPQHSEPLARSLLDEVLDRHHQSRTYDLYGSDLAR